MNSQTHQTTNRQPNVRTSVRVQIEQSRLRLRNSGETQAHQTFRTSWSKSKVWTSCNNLNIGEMTTSEQEETISQQANGRAKSICANKMVDEAKHFWSTVDHFQKQEKEMMKHFPNNRDHFRTRKKREWPHWGQNTVSVVQQLKRNVVKSKCQRRNRDERSAYQPLLWYNEKTKIKMKKQWE